MIRQRQNISSTFFIAIPVTPSAASSCLDGILIKSTPCIVDHQILIQGYQLICCEGTSIVCLGLELLQQIMVPRFFDLGTQYLKT